MKKKRRKIYIKITPERNKIVYSGIEFAEFMRYLQQPIENLLLMKGDYCGNRYEHNFELIEGYEYVEEFTKENVYNYGNFCFVDYISADNIAMLSDNQIAELLYLSHMFKPLASPFFKTMQNRFAYLAHDDGWYCKLYCTRLDDFADVLCAKIKEGLETLYKEELCQFSQKVGEQLLELAENGLLIDLDETYRKKSGVEVKLYIVGECLNMDEILNDIKRLKDDAFEVYNLSCAEIWTVTKLS
jgi:hypothetical protein